METKIKVVKAVLEKTTMDNKYIRNEFATRFNKKLYWNFSLPFCIDETGSIKTKMRKRVLDGVRNSFGIDFTRDIKVGNKELQNLKKSLANKIKDMEEEGTDIETLNELKRKLRLFNFRNDTYNKYELRKKLFDYNTLEKLLASFLLVTGQVVFKNSGYVYELDKGIFYKVTKIKSFDKLEPFNQQVFSKSYKVSSKTVKTLQSKRWTLTDWLSEENSALVSTDIKYNLMYSSVLMGQVKKLNAILKDSDVKKILKSLYTYRVSISKKLDSEESIYVKDKTRKLIEGIVLYKKGKKKDARKIINKILNGKFIKIFKDNIPLFVEVLGNYFYTKQEVYNKKEIDTLYNELELKYSNLKNDYEELKLKYNELKNNSNKSTPLFTLESDKVNYV